MDVLRSDALSTEELGRYSRHLLLPEVGMAGQRRLKAASVLLVGAGGLGSPLALYLAAAGVGRLGIVDDDIVDATNLQRQVIHDTPSVGQLKVASAARRIAELNPHVDVQSYSFRLDAASALDVVRSYDVIADGSDNFPTRFLINDACVIAGKPNVHGSVYRFEGQASVFDARRGPCYRCLFPTAPPPEAVPSCAEAGVLGVLPGIIGLIQATETIKLLLDIGEPLIGRLLMFDALAMRFASLAVAKDRSCPVCGERPSITELRDEAVACATTLENGDASNAVISPRTLHDKLVRGEPIALLDVREPAEREIVKLNNTFEIPLADLAERMSELPQTKELVVYCRSGARSARAVEVLRAAGLHQARSLAGGINAWSEEVDPTLTRY